MKETTLIPTINEFAPRYFAMKSDALKQSSLALYRKNYGLHIEESLGARTFLELTRVQIKDWYLGVCSRVSPAAGRSALTMLSAILDWYILEYEAALPLHVANPAKLPTSVKVRFQRNKNRVRFIPREAAKKALTARGVPAERRIHYALLAYTGMRTSEAQALTWGDWERGQDGLSSLSVTKSFSRHFEESTKTGVNRLLPVHEDLEAALAAWKAHGWAECFGRAPKAADLIVPRQKASDELVHRCTRYSGQRWDADKKVLQLPASTASLHGWRSSFLSWAEADGADGRVLRRVTHASHADVYDGYLIRSWATLSEHVARLRLVGDGALIYA